MPDFYGTAQGFRDYHEARGRNVDGFDDDPEVEAGLLVASEWLDARYGSSFPGTKVGMRSQTREWPRNSAADRDGYVIPADAVPVEIERATYEATLRQLAAPGSLSVDWTPSKYKRASVDGAVSVEYAGFSMAMDAQTRFTVIDEILAPILSLDRGSSMLSGRACRV